MTLEILKAKNPDLKLYSVYDEAFRPYGRVLEGYALDELQKAMLAAPLPETGNMYVADDPAVHAVKVIEKLEHDVFGGMPVEAGYCNGHGFMLNALEYHKCSEINYSPTGCVLLMALPSDIHDRRIQSADVVGFYLPPEVLVEVHPLVLHFAPCRVTEEGFKCLVILENGTNTPIDGVDTSRPGEPGLLWMRNKWLIAHPESTPAKNGAFVGIDGENLAVNI